MPRGWKRGAVVGVLVLLLAWFVACFVLVGHPRVDHPSWADAVVVLGSPEENGRLVVAQQLLDDGVASTIVVSMNSDQQQHARQLCDGGRAGYYRPVLPTRSGDDAR